MHSRIQKVFQNFVFEFNQYNSDIYDLKIVFISILKTEGDILIELRDYHRGIQAYKALRNYC